MNLFVTSHDPKKSAQYLDTKRVIKMVLETAQILSTVITFHGGKAPYRPTHKNHPVVVWCGLTKSNWDWTFKHFNALCQEYTARTGKIHKCQSLTEELLKESHVIPSGDLTPFVNCAANASLGLNFKHIENVHEAYKLYLTERWKRDKIVPKWS